MAKSKAFERIRSDVIAIVQSIPAGRVASYGDIGNYMTVMPRHVAYILSKLGPEEQDAIPWYRVVGSGGALGKDKYDARGQSQKSLLRSEGIMISNSSLTEFESIAVIISELEHDIKPGKIYSV